MKNKTYNQKVLRDFREFGSHMQIIAILSVLSFVIPFVSLIELVFLFIALGDIRRIYHEMPNARLMEFRSKYIISFVVGLLGLVLIIGGAINLIMLIFGFVFNDFVVNRFFLVSLAPMIIMFLLGIIVLFISSIIEYNAWNSLSKFFEENRDMFPETIARDAIKGANNVKIGVLLTMTLVLAIFGVILIIVGYFKLSALKKLDDGYRQHVIVQPQITSPYVQSQAQQVVMQTYSNAGNFCSQCGARIEREATFCPMCGKSLNM